MTNKKIIIITVSLTLIHFVLTSFSGHYISVQIGTQVGQVVSDGLIEASDNSPDKAQEEATRIYQNMETKSDYINTSWKIHQLLISLPARSLITPLLKDIRKQQMNKVIAKEITHEQFRTHGLMLDFSVNFLNSLSLGLLVYVGLRLFYRTRPIR
jgi:hypothetical protein